MSNYNLRLLELRHERGLTLKAAAKQIGISRFRLYFYENGYFKPPKKALKKIDEFYHARVSLKGIDGYPAPTKEKSLANQKVENLTTRRVVSGVLSALLLVITFAGVVLFNKSINNASEYYGPTYNELRSEVIKQGDIGYDIVTSLKYYHVSEEELNSNTTIIFYETNNILYFNECTYTDTVINADFGLDRYHIQIGSNLGINSRNCTFTFGSVTYGTYFSCSFIYDGDPVEELISFKPILDVDYSITEQEAIDMINDIIYDVDERFDHLVAETLGRPVDFANQFLADREKGRSVNYALQLTGLIMMVFGIVAFYLAFGLFLRLMLRNVKPKLISLEAKDKDKYEDVPEDISLRFGIPDTIVVVFGKICQISSLVLLVLSFIAGLGVSFLSGLSNPILLTIFKYSLLGGIFLEHFVMINRIKNPRTLFHQIIYNLGLFLLIATLETVAIAVTNAWGYDFANLIYKYIPSNVFQVVAVHYLIFLFLFFQPRFLGDKRRWPRVVWHSLSIIPLGFLIVTYILSNSYALIYGVKENVFINFWFPNGFISLSLVCVIFLYVTFFIRLHYEKKFGQRNAMLFFYGEKYALVENIICASLIIVASAIDFIFMRNQFALYMGLGNNQWMFILVPFILLCRYSPNNQQVFLVDEGLLTRMEPLKAEENPS